MSAPAGAQRDPRPSAVSMRALLAAGLAASAVSTPPARQDAQYDDGAAGAVAAGRATGVGGVVEQAAPESEAA
ncbi:hypothetical protein [Streptomyces sp. NBC_01408]|uniref:hypothetical protein n=1 Tax=Streptomyces sp. NBC_01408 TaxID=2903855 RepID=UPI00225047AB|nr:hypothetical protein [Streptomyces sp. NBC_01408]MCX4691530.1 hypothetical protein [Streptomyces sp. NBC_01408]